MNDRMRAPLAALAILVASASAPALAGPIQTFGNWMISAGNAQRHFLTRYDAAPISPHCRAVIAHPQKYGSREVKSCKGQ